jgi:hypothetical protein
LRIFENSVLNAHYFTNPHLLSTSADGHAHAVATSLSWDGEQRLISAGKRSLATVAANTLVRVLWAPSVAGDYSLIVDGEAVVRGSGSDAAIAVTITRGVLKRPGAPTTPTAGGCGRDCRLLSG